MPAGRRDLLVPIRTATKRIETRRFLLPEIKPRGPSYRTHRNIKHPQLIKKGSVTRLTLPFYGEGVPINRPFPLF